MKKTLTAIIITVLACSCVIGATLALLMDSTDPIENTFTVGDIDIELSETNPVADATGKRVAKMIPGSTIPKDPTVTVKAGSEACYLFVLVGADNVKDFISYDIDSAWTQINATDPVYYIEIDDLTETDTPYPVLAGNKVTVKDTVTKAMGDALTESTYPSLTFMAFAIQKENVATPQEAFELIVTHYNPQT